MKTRTLTFGLLLAGAVLGIGLVPTAAASDCVAYVNVPYYGWTCVPPGHNGPCIGYVYDPVYQEWRCIPAP